MSGPPIAASLRFKRGTFSLEVSMTLPGQGVTVLFGPSGSGKTTVLRFLAGLLRTQGTLHVGDEVWQDGTRFLPTHRRPVGYVFQDANLFPHLTVRRNVEYGYRRIPPEDRLISLDHVIDLLGIGHLLSRHPAVLSGGEKQRVGIARALATSPRLLLMDEPLASLDPPRKKEILPYLERLRDDLNLPIVYVSHSPDEVGRLADHLVIVDEGKVVAQGPLAQVLSDLELPIRLGEDAGVVLMGVVGERDAEYHLARLDFAGGSLWARDHGLERGRKVRVRVLARDVSISLAPTQGTSILNCLSGVVEAIAPDAHPAQVLLRMRFQGQGAILARLTRRSVEALGLVVGATAWAQIKTVALLE